jgi:hypothetical protein
LGRLVIVPARDPAGPGWIGGCGSLIQPWPRLAYRRTQNGEPDAFGLL